jgi:hypothetical protein
MNNVYVGGCACPSVCVSSWEPFDDFYAICYESCSIDGQPRLISFNLQQLLVTVQLTLKVGVTMTQLPKYSNHSNEVWSSDNVCKNSSVNIFVVELTVMYNVYSYCDWLCSCVKFKHSRWRVWEYRSCLEQLGISRMSVGTVHCATDCSCLVSLLILANFSICFCKTQQKFSMEMSCTGKPLLRNGQCGCLSFIKVLY